MIKNALAQQQQTIKDMQPDLILLCGDLSEPNPTPEDILQIADYIRWIDDYCLANQATAHIIKGNHDRLTTMQIVSSITRRVIVTADQIVRFPCNVANVVLVPWIDAGQIPAGYTYASYISDEIEDKIIEGQINVLCGHVELDGHVLKKGPCTIPVEALHPDRFDAIYLGHIHAPGPMYCGSPCPMTWGETHDSSIRMYDTDRYESIVIPINTPKMWSLDLDLPSQQDQLAAPPPGAATDLYRIRYTVEDHDRANASDIITAYLSRLPYHSIQVEEMVKPRHHARAPGIGDNNDLRSQITAWCDLEGIDLSEDQTAKIDGITSRLQGGDYD
jgi:predicted phosphodiesterase